MRMPTLKKPNYGESVKLLSNIAKTLVEAPRPGSDHGYKPSWHNRPLPSTRDQSGGEPDSRGGTKPMRDLILDMAEASCENEDQQIGYIAELLAGIAEGNPDIEAKIRRLAQSIGVTSQYES